MSATVQARLDEETLAKLEKLVKRTGLSASEVVREGIRTLEDRYSNQKRPRLTGVGEFDFGVSDLATNKKHMHGIGKKWRNGKWDW